MKYPIICHGCGHRSIVREATLAAAHRAQSDLECVKCGSTDVDLDDSPARQAAHRTATPDSVDLSQGRADGVSTEVPHPTENNRAERLEESLADGEMGVAEDILAEASRELARWKSRRTAYRGEPRDENAYPGWVSDPVNPGMIFTKGDARVSRVRSGEWIWEVGGRIEGEAFDKWGAMLEAEMAMDHYKQPRQSSIVTDPPMQRVNPDKTPEEVQAELAKTPPNPYSEGPVPQQDAIVAPSMDNGEEPNSPPKSYDGGGVTASYDQGQIIFDEHELRIISRAMADAGVTPGAAARTMENLRGNAMAASRRTATSTYEEQVAQELDRLKAENPTQDPEFLRLLAEETVVDRTHRQLGLAKRRAKLASIAQDVLTTNPGLDRKLAFEVARRTIERFPGVGG